MAYGHNPLYTARLHSAADWHVSFVYGDPDFIKLTKYINEMAKRPGVKSSEVNKLVQATADKFGVSTEDVRYFMLPLYIERRHTKTSLDYDLKSNRASISFDFDANKAEVLEEWERFAHIRQYMGKKPAASKRKPPENPKLLYAMHKARKRKEGFKKIFQQYSEGKLPGYTGKPTQFEDEDSLESYYHRYYKNDKPIT